MKYRTEEQFESIMNNALNGNWADSFKEAEEAGFYAQDLIRKFEELDYKNLGYEFEDLIYIAEGAERKRNN